MTLNALTQHVPRRSRHRGIAVVTGLMAVAGYAGALGLVGGGIDLGEPITSRLPVHSPILGGIALLSIVAVPMTAASIAIWRGTAHADQLAILAGLALLDWIAVELAFIRSFSWLQPVCAAYGFAVAAAAAGRRAHRTDSAAQHIGLNRAPTPDRASALSGWIEGGR